MRARRRDERGASVLELAFLAPALLALIFFSIQAALYFYGRTVAIQSSREGVSQLRLAQDAAIYQDIQGSVIANVESYADRIGSGALNDVVATSQYDDQRGRVSVEVTGNVISLVPLLDLSVTIETEGNVERFRGDQE